MKNNLKSLTLTAMFLAIGLVLPFLTGQIPQIGNMLLPMHIPVFLCALICGWEFATPMAFILPLMRSAIFTMPPFFPSAVGMAFELAAYAFVTGFLYKRVRNQSVKTVYLCMITAMIAGRAVWGVARTLMLSFDDNPFTLSVFLSGAFLTAIPGIIIQLILIPLIMVALDRTGLVPFKAKSRNKTTEAAVR